MVFSRSSIPPALLYASANALPALAQLLLLPLYGWILGTSEFGLLSLIQATLFILQLLTGAPFSAAISRFWYENPDNRNLKTTAHLLALFLTAILISVHLISPFPEILSVRGFTHSGILFAIIIACLSALESQYLAALVQQKKSSIYLQRVGLHTIGALVGSTVGLYIGQNNHESVLVGRFIGMACAIVPFAFLSMIEGRFQSKQIKQILQFTWPILPYLLISQALLFSERWITGILINESYAGFLSIAIALISLNEMAFQAVRNQIQPDIYHSWTENNKDLYKQSASIYLKYSLIVYLLSFPLACLAVVLLLPPAFLIVLSLLPWIQAAYWFRLTFILDSLVEFYSPRSWTLSLASLLGLVLALCISWFLIPVLGFLGSAFSFLVSRMVISQITRVIIVRRKDFYHFSYPSWTIGPLLGYLISGVMLQSHSASEWIVWLGAFAGTVLGIIGLKNVSLKES